ncbi:unnamed protein product [Hyaloperonospora brassicae]|uniref:BZIP domain-containing protein n=1 Tax=Hyaloperonospora brassicae TaxID=162125 RepID=A0AAV0UYS7_HYABA|nr:unnamed protein product [Hyaloperonospora brassicae]
MSRSPTPHELEFAAVCTFLNELSLDEIIQCGGGRDSEVDALPSVNAAETVVRGFRLTSYFHSDESNCSWEDDDDDDRDDLAREWATAGVTSSEGSDSDDLHERHARADSLAASKAKRLRTESQRELQRSYDRKFRTNKRARRLAGCETFIAALQELTVLMQYRLARTENELHVLCLAKKKKRTTVLLNASARRQLEQNQGVVQCIQSCTSSWRQEKSGELGKYFLRDQAKKIQGLVDELLDLRMQLDDRTEELRWRVEEETTGVWV